LQNKFGNIYANWISEPGKTVNHPNYIIFNKDSYYGEKGQNLIDWSLDTKRSLKKNLLQAMNPKKVEPTFILEIGSKKTASNTF
jgi:hypothetical protein